MYFVWTKLLSKQSLLYSTLFQDKVSPTTVAKLYCMVICRMIIKMYILKV